MHHSAKEVSLEYTHYLYSRLVSIYQLPLALPPIALPYTILRPCGTTSKQSAGTAGHNRHAGRSVAPECNRFLDFPFKRLAGLTFANRTEMPPDDVMNARTSLARYHVACYCEWLARGEGFCPDGTVCRNHMIRT